MQEPAIVTANQRFVNILAGLSLTLCVATAILWVRSYVVTDLISCETTHNMRWRIASEEGVLAYWEIYLGHRDTRRLQWERSPRPIGLQAILQQDRGERTLVRYWQVALWTSALPAWQFFLRKPIWWLRASLLPESRRQRRLRLGLCVHCGYDLRASADRCPQCGTPNPLGAR